MGGVVDAGVGLDAKTSPRQAAIEKAQAELRKEYDVRERRRRELEFLEKGGNPLDFKYTPPAAISLQSTSVADQLLAQEEKGSFALATSTQGDSNESSGRPSAPSARETNIDDNLVLFDGANSASVREKSLKHPGKRKSRTLLEKTSNFEEDYDIKESEENAILRLSVKSQAYARRNRCKSSREISYIGLTEPVAAGHGNRAPLPASQPGTYVLPSEARMDNHAAAIYDSGTASIDDHNASKGMELDLAPPNEASMDETEEPEERPEIATKKIEGSVGTELHSQCTVGQYINGVPSTSIGAIRQGEENPLVSHIQGPNETPTQLESSIISNFSAFDPIDNGLNNVDRDSKKHVTITEIETSISNTLEPEPSSAKVNFNIDERVTNVSHLSRVPDGHYNESIVEQNLIGEPALVFGSTDVRQNGCIKAADVNVNDGSNLDASSSNAQTKNENLLDEKTDKQVQMSLTTYSKNTNVDSELPTKAERETDDSSSYTHITLSKAANSEVLRSNITVLPKNESLNNSFSIRDSEPISEPQNVSGNNIKVADKAHEDAILKEARIIETKLKRAGELPRNFWLEKKRRSHWDYVLEEMSWLANDFIQERLWKITAAAQICQGIALNGRLKFQEGIQCRKLKVLARTLAEAVMSFWLLAEENQASLEDNYLKLPIHRYAVHFLKSDCSPIRVTQVEAPRTPRRTFNAVSLGKSWEEQLSEEGLHYKVPAGSMKIYRESVEAHWLHHEKMENKMQQVDCETSVCDSATEFKSHNNVTDEDEAETAMVYLPGSLEANRSKFSFKNRKNLHQRSNAGRPYETGFDLHYNPSQEGKLGVQPTMHIGKRLTSTMGVGSIPTKRVRSAARQRLISPFNTSATGAMQVTSKTDASSGDTNSFQDEQSSLQGGSQPNKNSEFESTVDFENQITFGGAGLPVKHKKKKPKYMGYKSAMNSTDCGVFVTSGKGALYDQRWPTDSFALPEQKDHSKKRSENRHYESNGSGGLYMNQAAKKPKLVKHFPENSSEAAPGNGPMASPVTSQMSNMSNSNKLLRVIQRDRGRKIKSSKVSAGLSGPGTPWSLFEDQALVVLVHDMGPNWELISDAINGTLQFKCIHRKPKDCKERHKFLMDKSASDGADSAEDSGSSQPYPSTLPGIPKGSARQLFQCLQGPMEEDTMKSHFEKIIHIGQKIHSRKSQDNHDLKQISPVHNSHVLAISQACPNNLSGGPLTPLDLCDTIASSSEVIGLQYQGPHTNGLPLSNQQGHAASILPASGANSVVQGSPGMAMGNSYPSPSAALSAPTRDAPRYGVPRPSSSPVDDQQRMHQYNQMITGRNVPGALPVRPDRSVRMLPGGNGMGVMCGVNRGIPMTRPAFHGVGSPAALNMVSSGSMVASTGPASIQSGSVSSQGNSLVRPRDGLQMLKVCSPSQNSEDHRQMIMQELQMQGSQGNSQPITPFSGMSAPYTNQTVPSQPVQTFPAQQHQLSHQIAQQPHILGNSHHPHVQGSNQSTPQQQAYAMRLAKERQIQQRLLHQQSFPSSNSMASMQNSPQLQQPSQPSMTPVSSPSSLQKQNVSRNPQSGATLPNQIMKQRQRQQIQQQQQQQQLSRQQGQQPQQVQQQAKLLKGAGRASVLMHQSLPSEASPMNGPTPGSQVLDKHMMQQSQASFTGNLGSNPTSHPSNQQKIYARPPSHSSKQMPAMSSHPEPSNQGNQVSANQPLLASQQQSAFSNQPQRQASQSHQKMQRVVLHQNRQLTSDKSKQPGMEPFQVHQNSGVQTIPHCTDTVGVIPDATSASLVASPWKSEESFESSSLTPPTHTSNSPQTNLTGTESLMVPSSQGLVQRQFSGSVSVHGQGIGGGGSWQAQQPPSQKQQPPPPLQHQLHRQVGQGSLYRRPSNSGPG